MLTTHYGIEPLGANRVYAEPSNRIFLTLAALLGRLVIISAGADTTIQFFVELSSRPRRDAPRYCGTGATISAPLSRMGSVGSPHEDRQLDTREETTLLTQLGGRAPSSRPATELSFSRPEEAPNSCLLWNDLRQPIACAHPSALRGIHSVKSPWAPLHSMSRANVHFAEAKLRRSQLVAVAR